MESTNNIKTKKHKKKKNLEDNLSEKHEEPELKSEDRNTIKQFNVEIMTDVVNNNENKKKKKNKRKEPSMITATQDTDANIDDHMDESSAQPRKRLYEDNVEHTKKKKKKKSKDDPSITTTHEELPVNDANSQTPVDDDCDDDNSDPKKKRKKKKKKKKMSEEAPAGSGKKSIRRMKWEKFCQRQADEKASAKEQLKTQTLSYLSQWKYDRANWKFMKARQVWLYKTKFSSTYIPEASWPLLLEYFESTQGNIRKMLLQDANKVIAQMDEWSEKNAGSNPKESDVENADGESPESDKPDIVTYKRARDLIQCLQE